MLPFTSFDSFAQVDVLLPVVNNKELITSHMFNELTRQAISFAEYHGTLLTMTRETTPAHVPWYSSNEIACLELD